MVTMIHGSMLPEAGERWRKVSAGGEGVLVEIRRTTVNKVQFRTINGRAAGRKSDEIVSRPIQAFLRDYAPADPPSVIAKREQMRAQARTQTWEADQPKEPTDPEVSAHVTIADNGAVLCTCPDYLTNMTRGRTGYQCRHIKRVAQEGYPEELVMTAKKEVERAPSIGHPPKLTGEQAREVFLLRGSASASEVGRLYGVSHARIMAIWNRESYRWATDDLAEATANLPASGDLPEPPQEEPPAVHLIDERKVESFRKSGRFYSVRTWSNGSITCTCTDFEQNGAMCAHVRDRIEAEGADRLNGIIEPPKEAIVPAETNQIVKYSTEVREVIGNLADYAEILAQYAGKPLPRLVKLDLEAVRHEISRARSVISDI